MLGTPFFARECEGVYPCYYKYRFSGSPPEVAWAEFTFGTDSDQLTLSEGAFGNVGWTLTAKPGQPGMKVALWLAPA